MDDDLADAYGRIMLLETIFKSLLIGIYGHGMDPIKGIALLTAQKSKVLDDIEGMVIQEFDSGAAGTAVEAMKARAEELFDEAIEAIRKERGISSPSASDDTPIGGKTH